MGFFVLNKVLKIEKNQSQNNLAYLHIVYIQIESHGYYIFTLDSNDGSKLYLTDKLLINNDGLHDTGNSKILPLISKKGLLSC